jgi:hypothetical protein
MSLRSKIVNIMAKGKYLTDTADQILALLEGQRCEWTPRSDDHYEWDTNCGAQWYFEDDPDFELAPFCPMCGKRIEVKDAER